MLDEIINKTEGIRSKLIKFRREIHGNPELGGSEKNTAAFIAGILEANDIEIVRDVAGHGIVGLLRGSGEKTIALRADLDALPLQEQSDVQYSSTIAGVMHACGHDVHSAILIGAAIILGSMRERLKGNVKFIFQPAEETPVGGANDMIKAGVLDAMPPSMIVALHCYPELEVGRIAHRPGLMAAAADRIKIVVKGKSAHASRPHQSVDAVLVSSMVINAIHHIVSRQTNPLHAAVISIGTIRGGTAENIIADRVEMEGTVRTLDNEMRKKMPSIIENSIKGVTGSVGAEYEFSYECWCPPVINDIAVDKLVRESAEDMVGKENVVLMPQPTMGSEDFAFFTEKVPGALFRLGTSNKDKGLVAPLHNPKFDVDEDSLVIGTKMMSWIAARYVNDL